MERTGNALPQMASLAVLTITVLTVVVAVRLAALLLLGPAQPPDSSTYVNQASCIFKTINGVSTPCPRGNFKAVGYGFVILSFQEAFGSNWKWALALFQTGLSLVASLLLARALFGLTRSLPLALLLFALHALSVPLMIDPLILRDSLFASLLTIFIGYVTWQAAERRAISSPIPILLLGLLLAVAASLREQLALYAIFLVPLVLVWLAAAHTGVRQVLLVLILFAGAIALSRVGQSSWNQLMTGDATVSTNARTVMLQAILPVASKHPALFEGNTELDRAARETLRTYRYPEVVQLNRTLRREGLSEHEIGRLAVAKYFEAWRRYPLTQSIVVAQRLFKKSILGSFNPGKSILMQKGYIERDTVYFSATKTMQQATARGDVADVIFVVLWRVGEFVSYLLYISAWACVLVSAYRLIVGRAFRRDGIILALFAAYFGVVFTHALAHIELRQVAGVAGILLLLSLYFWGRIAEWRRRYNDRASRLA